MYCPRCGAASREPDRFCAACGLDLSGYGVPPGGEPQAAQWPAANQAPRYRPLPAYEAYEHIPSYLGWAIAVLILCFPPTGIPAVVYAAQVDNKLARGDFAGARASSRNAKIWCWVSLGIGIALWVLTIIMIAALTTIQYGRDLGGGPIY